MNYSPLRWKIAAHLYMNFYFRPIITAPMFVLMDFRFCLSSAFTHPNPLNPKVVMRWRQRSYHWYLKSWICVDDTVAWHNKAQWHRVLVQNSSLELMYLLIIFAWKLGSTSHRKIKTEYVCLCLPILAESHRHYCVIHRERILVVYSISMRCCRIE